MKYYFKILLSIMGIMKKVIAIISLIFKAELIHSFFGEKKKIDHSLRKKRKLKRFIFSYVARSSPYRSFPTARWWIEIRRRRTGEMRPPPPHQALAGVDVGGGRVPGAPRQGEEGLEPSGLRHDDALPSAMRR
jgi:hypothetical protein